MQQTRKSRAFSWEEAGSWLTLKGTELKPDCDSLRRDNEPPKLETNVVGEIFSKSSGRARKAAGGRSLSDAREAGSGPWQAALAQRRVCHKLNDYGSWHVDGEKRMQANGESRAPF
jgi:hypothetical protein